jgi:hypothetical protein
MSMIKRGVLFVLLVVVLVGIVAGQSIEDQTVEGFLEVVHVDYFDDPVNTRIDSFLVTDEWVKYKLYGEFPVVLSGTRARVRGTISGGGGGAGVGSVIPFDVSNFEIISGDGGGAGILANDNLGEQKTLVILTGDSEKEYYDNLIFGDDFGTVKDYYIKNSYGQTTFEGDVVGPYGLEFNCGDDEVGPSLAAAEKDVIDLGRTLDYYDRLILRSPRYCGSLPAGSGNIGKTNIRLPDGKEKRMSISWIYSSNLHVFGHELGHNLGVHHANLYSCKDSDGNSVDFGFNCISSEYDDPYSIMGIFSTGHHTAPHKMEIGWFSDENVVTADEGTFRITPLELKEPVGSVKMIRVPIAIETSHYANYENIYYSVELRQPLDYDTGWKEIYKGISIRIAVLNDDGSFSYRQSSLLTFDDGSQSGQYRLLPGESFIDNINGIKITLDTLEGEGEDAVATVSVDKTVKIEVNLNRPLVFYKFDEEIRRGRLLIDSAGIFSGGRVQGGSFVNGGPDPESSEGGILFHEKGSDNGYEEGKHFSEFVEMGPSTIKFIVDKNNFVLSTKLKLKSYPEIKGNVFQFGWSGGRPRNLFVSENGYLTFSLRYEDVDVFAKKTVNSLKPLELDEWYDISAVYNGEFMILYINGEEQGRDSFEKIKLKSIRSYYLGGLTYGYGINGILDDFKIFVLGERIDKVAPNEILNIGENINTDVSFFGKFPSDYGDCLTAPQPRPSDSLKRPCVGGLIPGSEINSWKKVSDEQYVANIYFPVKDFLDAKPGASLPIIMGPNLAFFKGSEGVIRLGTCSFGGGVFGEIREGVRDSIGLEVAECDPSLAITLTDTLSLVVGDVRGDVNRNGVIDISDAVFILSWLFVDPNMVPECENSAEVNGDGTVNVADATYLLNFLFLGGPAPAGGELIC